MFRFFTAIIREPVSFGLFFFRQDDPPVSLLLTSSDGTADLSTQGGVVGEPANFGATVIPSNAAGGSRKLII